MLLEANATAKRSSSEGSQVRSNNTRRDAFVVVKELDIGEAHVVQTSRDIMPTSAKFAIFPQAALIHTSRGFSCVHFSDVKKEYLCLTAPVAVQGEFRVNGHYLGKDALFVHESNLFVGHGGPREVLNCVLWRDSVVRTLAALQGVDPDDSVLPVGELQLPALAVKRLKTRLIQAVATWSSRTAYAEQPENKDLLSQAIFDLILDFMVCAVGDNAPQYQSRRSPSWIVRAAEQRFIEANGAPLSLADLCEATRVSASTLTLAFRSVTGMTPARYIKTRRMSQAHELLRSGAFNRSPVKRAALSVGLTDLGRFSVEYKALFGHSPSATGSRVQPPVKQYD